MCGGVAALTIGDPIRWRERSWILRGFDPMGVPERRVELEDADSGERLRVPLDDVCESCERRL
ncbi:MAG TPA: hypothetical protein VNT58_07855 [Gaiellaceae bacterium]|nr:hypothetical protein [Gaiellaceae bacterium]